jgi:DNA-directed RNA polymerase specialized sigma24 family protein
MCPQDADRYTRADPDPRQNRFRTRREWDESRLAERFRKPVIAYVASRFRGVASAEDVAQETLRRVLDLGPDVLYPGHGPALTEDPTAVVRYYLEHRAFRQQQILAVLADAPADVETVVATIYAEVDRRLWPAAERSTRAALDVLLADGVIAAVGDDEVRLA